MSGPDGVLPGARSSGRFLGVSVGIVTGTDPDGLGRVQVKLQWLPGEPVIGWARVATPMAGPGRGLYFPLELDDEVLVAFEHGNPESPYVLGALWNGRDRPPEPADDGAGNRRTIRSRSGHVVRFVDEKDGEKIEIVDASTKNTIVIDSTGNSIAITADGDVTITAGGRLTLSGRGVEITSSDDVAVESQTNGSVRAGARLELGGRQVAIN